MRAITPEERRHRLAVRHRLAPSARTDDVVAIARSVVALHATDPSTVVLSALQRMRTPDPSAVERALYDDRTLVRMLAMRRTLFTVAVADAGVIQHGCGDAVATAERTRFLAVLEKAPGLPADRARWLRRIEAKAMAALGELGEATVSELSARVPELARQIPVGVGTRHPVTIGLGSRVVFLLAARGRLVRGRPKGTWTSSLHRWATVEDWLGGPLAPMPAAAARTELARRWLSRFGPAPLADLRWWTGWTLGATRAALADLATEPVDLDGVEGVVLAGDLDPTPAPGPWVALLPSLDPTTMGWQQRAWYLGDHKAPLFDPNGNAGPTVWADGRIVGGWAQRRTGEVAVRLLQDVGHEQEDRVASAAAALQQALGDVRVVPRFPTPLALELTA